MNVIRYIIKTGGLKNMSRQDEIQVELTKNVARLKEILDPTTFVLNDEAVALNQANFSLMKECERIGHDYDETGHCKYCDAKKI